MSTGNQSWQLRVIRVLFKVLALLTIDLVVQIVNIQIMDLQKYIAPVYVTLLGMLLVVLLFYFLMAYIEQWTNALLKYVVELGKTFRYRKTAVMAIILTLMFCAFFAYYRLWFGKWIGFSDLPKVFSAPILR
ncbi:MAG TPA: hypothetical protein PKM44_08185 [Turneriella sp.]|nr:hypothetical protein [Turneriella sp.]HNA79679.1 hypothetical protein [Turneriella sp.]HNE19624.1 hypothetical protein [Turneriella sp.]HNL10475.1 hypothetical protein [Turneriella sp.]HNL55380.1 hypothetical protein [Turneriella sp.]